MQVTGHGWLATVIGVIIGVAALYVFYKVVRTDWPLSYASLSGDPGVVVNRTLGKYLVFALGPTYVVALICSTMVHREGGHAMICALAIGAIHTLRTQIMLLIGSMRQRRVERHLPTLIFSAITACGLVFASWLGGLGPGPAQFVVPPLEEFFNTFWTTATVVLVAAFIVRTMSSHKSIYDLVERSRRELGDELVTFARKVAAEYSTDPTLVEAILLTENLQRPRWFRMLEKLKGRISPSGTYGPMQVWSERPISDQESIRKAVREHLSRAWIKRSEYGSPKNEHLERALRRYNSNPRFVTLARDVYFVIDQESQT